MMSSLASAFRPLRSSVVVAIKAGMAPLRLAHRAHPILALSRLSRHQCFATTPNHNDKFASDHSGGSQTCPCVFCKSRGASDNADDNGTRAIHIFNDAKDKLIFTGIIEHPDGTHVKLDDPSSLDISPGAPGHVMEDWEIALEVSSYDNLSGYDELQMECNYPPIRTDVELLNFEDNRDYYEYQKANYEHFRNIDFDSIYPFPIKSPLDPMVPKRIRSADAVMCVSGSGRNHDKDMAFWATVMSVTSTGIIIAESKAHVPNVRPKPLQENDCLQFLVTNVMGMRKGPNWHTTQKNTQRRTFASKAAMHTGLPRNNSTPATRRQLHFLQSSSSPSPSPRVSPSSTLDRHSGYGGPPSPRADDEIQPYDEIPGYIMEMVEQYCKRQQTPVSMYTLMKTGRQELLGKTYRDEAIKGSLTQHQASGRVLIQVANFLRSELPVRLAHRIQDLHNVPMMRDMPSVQLVKGIYINSFVDLIRYGQIFSNEDERAFAHFLKKKYEHHSSVLIQMARGAYELRKTLRLQQGSVSREDKIVGDPFDFAQLDECHAFLDRFYMSRIGIRILAGQYLALREHPLPDYIGMICEKTSPSQIVRQAASDATKMCIKRYGAAPEVIMDGRLDLTFPYIPTYLHYMMLELLKNAMRATMERHGDSGNIPPVMVIIADEQDNEDVVVKVADVGGGIPRSNMKKIWSYLFTTADPKIQEDFIGDQDHDPNSSPLAGLGFGLPISRSYARYFNGDLNIMSMEGFHLKRLENPNH